MKTKLFIAAMLAAAGLAGAQMFAQLFGATSRLPAGFRECNYLESSGTQYIDTGVSSTPTMEFDLVFTLRIGSRFVIGQTTSTWGLRVYAGTPGFYRSGVLTELSGYSIVTNTPYRAKFDGTSFSTTRLGTGFAASAKPAAGTSAGGPIRMFGPDNSQSLWYGRIYRLKLSYSGLELRDFVPALDPQGVPCMYDFVTGAAFYNAGTGSFAYQLKE